MDIFLQYKEQNIKESFLNENNCGLHFKVIMNGQDSVKRTHTDKNGSIASVKCGKTFTQHGHLTRHMRMHMGQFKFYCDRCRKGFVDKSQFEGHMRKHEGLKYHCDYCAKQFANKHRYQYHLSVHTGKYRFSCERCNKGFNEQNSFQNTSNHAKYTSKLLKSL